jgi:uncharacterized protein
MASIGTDVIAAAAKDSPLQAKYGRTIRHESAPEAQPAPAAPPEQRPVEPGYPPLPTDSDIPPMPEPAEPKGPSMLEEILKNPTVKSGINTAIREAVKGIFGTGRRRK